MNCKFRNTAHPVSAKSVRIAGVPGIELFITLRTRTCSWKKETGGCTFCGVGGLDGDMPPLSFSEANLQVEGSIRDFKSQGGDVSAVTKVSFISMSDSLLNPMTIEERALRIAMETAVRAFPNVSCLSVESRADMLHSDYLNRLWDFMQNEFGNGVSGEVAVGVETASEYNRNLLGKGISDAVLVSASRVLSDTMWSMRGSLIYALFEHEPLARVLALKNGIDLMAGLGERMRTYTSILLLRGYVPEDMASSNLFRDFVEVPDEVVLRELREAALHAKRRKLHFEIDSTTADQEAVRATLGIMSPEYRAALDRYNQSLDPRELVLK